MNSRRPLLLVLLLFLSFANPSYAANWVDAGGNDSISVYVDTQSLRRSGAKVKVWTKWVYAKPWEVKGSYPAKTYQSSKQLSVYHCEERTTVTLQITRYVDSETAEVADDASGADMASRYSEVAPDTIGESLLEFACQRTATKKK